MVMSSSPNTGIGSAIGKYSPIATIIAFIALLGSLGYIAGNFLGSLLGVTDGQAAASDYLASTVINNTIPHASQAAGVIASQGAYYYVLSLTVPNTYSLVGLFIGALAGMLVAFAYIESKHG